MKNTSRERLQQNGLHDLIFQGVKKRLPKGEVIQSSESSRSINVVTKGFVKRYLITNNGALGVQTIYGPNDVFPLALAFQALCQQKIYEGPEVFYYEAMTDTDIYSIPLIDLVEATQKNPLLYKDLLSEAGKRLHFTLQGLENLTLENYYKRVAHQLVYYAREFGTETKRGVKITVPLTQQDIADVLSATRETVSICIGQLRSKGLVKTGKYTTIPDMELLEKEAYS